MKKPLGVIVDLICFVIGPFITAVNAFNWTAHSGGSLLEPGPISYHYPDEVRFGIGIGIALICFGILSRRWR